MFLAQKAQLHKLWSQFLSDVESRISILLSLYLLYVKSPFIFSLFYDKIDS